MVRDADSGRSWMSQPKEEDLSSETLPLCIPLLANDANHGLAPGYEMHCVYYSTVLKKNRPPPLIKRLAGAHDENISIHTLPPNASKSSRSQC